MCLSYAAWGFPIISTGSTEHRWSLSAADAACGACLALLADDVERQWKCKKNYGARHWAHCAWTIFVHGVVLLTSQYKTFFLLIWLIDLSARPIAVHGAGPTVHDICARRRFQDAAPLAYLGDWRLCRRFYISTIINLKRGNSIDAIVLLDQSMLTVCSHPKWFCGYSLRFYENSFQVHKETSVFETSNLIVMSHINFQTFRFNLLSTGIG